MATAPPADESALPKPPSCPGLPGTSAVAWLTVRAFCAVTESTRSLRLVYAPAGVTRCRSAR